jgi:hypothetical protein
MCALNAVVATLSTLVPLSSLFVIIFLPLVSVLTVILCEDKYAIIYLVAAIALSLGVTAYDITATLFYIIPAIVVGTLYGFLSKKNFPTRLHDFRYLYIRDGAQLRGFAPHQTLKRAGFFAGHRNASWGGTKPSRPPISFLPSYSSTRSWRLSSRASQALW